RIDDQLVGYAAEDVVVFDCRRDRLRVERIQPGVGRLARREHGRRRDLLRVADRPVEERGRLEALKLGVALELRQPEHTGLTVLELRRLEQADATVERAAQGDARG